MKRNNLTTAVVAAIAGVAGFAGLANAVNVNPDGLGQVLIYPYYTVNPSGVVAGAQDTLFSVVNTASVGKAVKVRFLEGYNSREVLDFNLFLSPHDVWTARISQTADASAGGGAALTTTDRSCIDPVLTYPYPFSASGYNGDLPGQPADGGPTDLTRTREGYLELISMGDIVPGSALDMATTHDHTGSNAGPDNGTPSCGAPVGNDAGTIADLVPPTGGLFGSGVVVNVPQGTFFGYNADAIDGFTEIALYTPPGDLTPTLQSANTPSVAVTGVARAFVFMDGGALLTADYARGVDAVSAVYMADAIYNEYLVYAGAATDWLITFPTKRFYVDQGLYPGAPIPPFEVPFTAPGTSNVLVGLITYDREEGHGSLERCPSPPPPNCFVSNPRLPYEVNVLGFQTSSLFGSVLYKSVLPYSPTAGWASMNLFNAPSVSHQLAGGIAEPSGAPVVLNGLPVTGFMGYNVINANVTAGVLANYGGLFRHRAHRSCSVDGVIQGTCS
jgi:hypothetical protein